MKDPEVYGLLALMLCHDARREARFADQELVLLEDQDRSLWDLAQINEGRSVLERAVGMGGRGVYVLQAAIAALQTDEPIDWPQVAALYGELATLTHSPVIELNRAVAVAKSGSPEVALQMVDCLSTIISICTPLAAELLVRLGRVEEAGSAYRRALELTRTEPERRFLLRRLAEL